MYPLCYRMFKHIKWGLQINLRGAPSLASFPSSTLTDYQCYVVFLFCIASLLAQRSSGPFGRVPPSQGLTGYLSLRPQGLLTDST